MYMYLDQIQLWYQRTHHHVDTHTGCVDVFSQLCMAHSEIVDLGDSLEVGVFAFHAHAPRSDQGPRSYAFHWNSTRIVNYKQVIGCIMQDILPKNLARRLHHIMHFWSYVSFRITFSK